MKQTQAQSGRIPVIQPPNAYCNRAGGGADELEPEPVFLTNIDIPW